MAHPYDTQANLNLLLGADLVTKLLDLDRDGVADSDVYAAVREEADREIDSTLGQKYSVPFGRTSDGAIPDMVITLSTYITAALLLGKRHKEDPQIAFYAGRAQAIMDGILDGSKLLIYADTGEEAAKPATSALARGFLHKGSDPTFAGVDDNDIENASQW